MAGREKQAERARRAKAFQELNKSVAAVDIYTPTASSLFEVLSKARLGESYAASIELARRRLFAPSQGTGVPHELSEATVVGHLVRAAELYATAASKCLRIPDTVRAYRYFHKAAGLLRRAAEGVCGQNFALWQQSEVHQHKAALVRQELARRYLCRRRLTLGLWRRRR